MIDIKKISIDLPYLKFINYYESALQNKQDFIEAAAVGSFDYKHKQPEVRFVNIKQIIKDEWIFYTNYNSLKAKNFVDCNKVSLLFFWGKINVQIRMKGFIGKTDKHISDMHFNNREFDKNIAAISSEQSKRIDNYEDVVQKFKKNKVHIKKNMVRPEFWGGYSFCPNHFEFWEGNKSRINKRHIFELSSNKTKWMEFFLEP